PPNDEAEALRVASRKLLDEYGSTDAVWREHNVPRVMESCSRLRTAPEDAAFADLAGLLHHAWQHTGVAAMLSSADLRAVSASCREVVGDADAELTAHELAQGYENETLSADAALW